MASTKKLVTDTLV